jgi:hypothetical protein
MSTSVLKTETGVYLTAGEIGMLNKLFSQPVAIVAACDRVHRETNHTIRRQHDRGWWAGFRQGVMGALTAVGIALAVAWVMQ